MLLPEVALITKWDLFVLPLARGLLVDLLPYPGGVQTQLPQPIVGKLPGGNLGLGINLHECRRVEVRLQLRQLVLVDREEDVELFGQVGPQGPAPRVVRLIGLHGDDPGPVQVLVDDLRLFPQFLELLLRGLVDLLLLIGRLQVHLVIMPVPRKQVRP